MPVEFDSPDYNTFGLYDDDGSGRGCVGPDTPPDTPQPDKPSPLDDPNFRSYWWERFTDITNPNPIMPGQPMTDDEIAAQWAFYGGNPLDLPLQNLSSQFRAEYEARKMFEQYTAERERANFEQNETNRLNAMAQEISDPQARADFIQKMQEYLNSHLTDNSSFEAAMSIHSSNTVSQTPQTVTSADSAAQSAGNVYTADSAGEAGNVNVLGNVNITADMNAGVSSSYGDLLAELNRRRTDSYLHGPMPDDGVNAVSPASESDNKEVGTVRIDLAEMDLLNSKYGLNLNAWEFLLYKIFEDMTKGNNLTPLDLADLAKQAAASDRFSINGLSHGQTIDFLKKDIDANGANLGNYNYSVNQIKNSLANAGIAIPTANIGTNNVTVTTGAQPAIETNGLPTISREIIYRPTEASMGGAAVLPAMMAGAKAMELISSTAATLSSSGAISAEVLGIITAAGPAIAAVGAGATLATIFNLIINQAKVNNYLDDKKIQVANELATLAIEVARKVQIAENASLKLGELTIVTNTQSKPTDWADPKPTTDWGIGDAPPGTLATTGSTAVQGSPSGEKPPQIPFDIDKILEAIRANLGPITTFLVTTALGVVTVNSIRGKDAVTAPTDSQKISDLANHRIDKGLPGSSSDYRTGTVASDGEDTYGYSTTLEREYVNVDSTAARKAVFTELLNKGLLPSGSRYNQHYEGLFLTHAESEVLIKLKDKYGTLEGKDIKIYVDRRTCDECYQGLPLLMALWNIKTITVFSSDDRYGNEIVVITNNAASNK